MSVSNFSAERDYPIRPVPFTDVEFADAFWRPRLATNRDVTVWYDFRKCEETGRIANFARAGGLEDGEFEGIPFNDSDVFKVIEGAAYSLALEPDPKLDAYLDALIAKIAAAQEDDGYLYSARTLGFTNDMTGPERWSNLCSNHELYNVGHMYEAAVAHHQATGKRSLLDVAIKNADLIDRVFGPNPGQRRDVPGHEEIEIGLARLYRETGEERYLKLAKFFVDERGNRETRGGIYGAHRQDHARVVDQSEAVGHAVRAGYLYAGVADVAALTGEEPYMAAIDRIWHDVVTCKLAVTGGIGARHAGEAFGDAYELPNAEAYNETCAAIANALWNHRMFLLHGDAKYIDVVERVVYNGFLAGISLSGDRFFYPNPLAAGARDKINKGEIRRAPWFGCSCCPVNVVRFIPSIPGYAYAVRDSDVYVNLFVGGSASVALPDGEVCLRQETEYPWSGDVALTLDAVTGAEFALRVRVPGWARNQPVPSDLYRYADGVQAPVRISVNGAREQPVVDQGYAVLRRRWQEGDTVRLELPMPVRRVVAHDNVEDDRGRVALERGPILYCLEGIDNDGTVADVVLPAHAEVTTEHCPDLLGGVTVLRASAQRAKSEEDGTVRLDSVAITAVPYYAWAHRDSGAMAVWIAASATR